MVVIRNLVLLVAVCAQSACGLLLVGAMAGGQALEERNARKSLLKELKGANDVADAARSQKQYEQALSAYRDAQRALNGYYFRYGRGKKLNDLAAEHKEIARTAQGLVAVLEAQNHQMEAIAVGAHMLPSPDGKYQISEVKTEAVATAPHVYAGKSASWSGEVRFARHDPQRDVTLISVVPYTFVSRQRGFRTESYYDNTFKTWRKRLVPRYVNVKMPLHSKAFMVELSGFNEKVLPGTAVTFVGKVIGDRATPTLGEAVAIEVSKAPGAQTSWYLGVDIPRG
ncbi:MAG: hypothetical protein H6707_07520 [Deltaproteobacteria bacterium]|nr:hypothetical protein [Deltaproteobacteria bacterium]